MSTVVPPAGGAPWMLSAATTGGGAVKVNPAMRVAVLPSGFATVTSTGPLAWGGVVTVIWVAATGGTTVPCTPPKSTTVPVTKLVPVTATVVLPPSGPDAGLTEATVGAGKPPVGAT